MEQNECKAQVQFLVPDTDDHHRQRRLDWVYYASDARAEHTNLLIKSSVGRPQSVKPERAIELVDVLLAVPAILLAGKRLAWRIYLCSECSVKSFGMVFATSQVWQSLFYASKPDAP